VPRVATAGARFAERAEAHSSAFGAGTTYIQAVRAATIQDGALSVEEHPDPVPAAGEVLVAVKAAGINGADMLQRKGAYPAPPGSPPDVPGLELAGEVTERGPGAERFAEGDRGPAL